MARHRRLPSSDSNAAIVTGSAVPVVLAYNTASEPLWRGQPPGRRLAQLTADREDGAPIGASEALVRKLPPRFAGRP